MKNRNALLMMLAATLPSYSVYAADETDTPDLYSVSVAALQDVSRNTDVSIMVTGPAAEEAKQILLKSFDVNGALRWVQTLHNTPVAQESAEAGRIDLQFADMERFQPVTAQVQIQSPESDNAEVLRNDATVLLRPDLEVKDVTAGEGVYKGAITDISVTLQELNGDLGANTVLYLKEGDAVIDVAKGVHVDAFGSTQVLFSTIFTEPGSHTLTVSAENVHPGDYDIANNAKKFSVNVQDREGLPYSLRYTHTQYDAWSEWNNPYSEGRDEQHNITQLLSQQLTLPHLLTYPIDRVRVDIVADGAKVMDFDGGIAVASVSDYGCYHFENAQVKVGEGASLNLSASTNTCLGTTEQTARLWQYAYDAVYFSESHDKYWGTSTTTERHNAGGAIITAHDQIETRIVISDDGASVGGTATAELTSSTKVYPWESVSDEGWSRGERTYVTTTGSSAGTTTP